MAKLIFTGQTHGDSPESKSQDFRSSGREGGDETNVNYKDVLRYHRGLWGMANLSVIAYPRMLDCVGLASPVSLWEVLLSDVHPVLQ